LIPTDRFPCEPLHAAHRGEGMTGSPSPAPHRETGTEDVNAPEQNPKAAQALSISLP
jgi:hypothetical protein